MKREMLARIFDLPVSKAGLTSFFKGVSHQELLDFFQAWLRFNCKLSSSSININIVDIQGMHDKGIDLIAELVDSKSGGVSTLGVQIKCDQDHDTNMERQVDITLANYSLFNIDYLAMIFCCDETNASHSTKEKMQISRIKQRQDKIFVIDAAHAVSIFSPRDALSKYINQFGGKKSVVAEVVSTSTHASGFPYFTIKYSSDTKSGLSPNDLPSLIKAYLFCILPIIGEDIISIGTIPFPFKRIVGKALIELPPIYLRGLEEHGYINLWGSDPTSNPDEFQSFFQLLITKREFEQGGQYKLIENKFLILLKRLETLGRIMIPLQSKA